MVFKMESDKKTLKRYKIIKFEDLILIQEVYREIVRINRFIFKVSKKIRLKSPILGNIKYLTPSKNNSHRWYDLE